MLTPACQRLCDQMLAVEQHEIGVITTGHLPAAPHDRCCRLEIGVT
jgi:hypothetical protein